METIQELSGWLGSGLTVLSFISPIFPYINVLKGKIKFEDTPATLVTVSYINYCCWYVYGDMIFSDQIKYAYVIGAGINIILIIIYLAFEVKKYLVDSIMNTLILITGTWALYRALTVIIDDDRIVGKICAGTSCLVLLSPIQILYKVIKDKNYRLIPFLNCFLIFLYSICWVVYGIFITDFYIVFPNAIAIILSFIEMLIFMNYKKKYPLIGDRDFSSTIGIESNGADENVKKDDLPIQMDEEPEATGKEKPVKIST